VHTPAILAGAGVIGMMRARLNSRLQRTQITGTSIVFPASILHENAAGPSVGLPDSNFQN
jgi:hypothetical protein